jgi:Sensors of blue-light using FAD
MTNKAAPDSGPDQVFRLIYRSQNRIPPADRKITLGTLFSKARSNNKRKHITGALLVSGDWFAQVLEGDESLVKELYEKIAADTRHDHITLLQTRAAANRIFSRWAMARVSEDGEPDIPLIAHTDGISPAAGHKTTPEQESVLSFMREATAAEHTQF